MSWKIYDEQQIIVDSGKRMLQKDLTRRSWGNISVRGKDGLMYITPSSIDYGDILLGDISSISMEGEVLNGNRKPSMEKDLHRLIYLNRPDVNAVIHTHPVYSKVFACLGENLPLIIDEAKYIFTGDVICAEHGEIGSMDLAEKALAALGDNMACLLKDHGAVCVGKDIDEAFKVAEILEYMAQIYYMMRSIK